MLKKVIAGWNAAPGAPANWNLATDDECGTLPTRLEVTGGHGCLVLNRVKAGDG